MRPLSTLTVPQLALSVPILKLDQLALLMHEDLCIENGKAAEHGKFGIQPHLLCQSGISGRQSFAPWTLDWLLLSRLLLGRLMPGWLLLLGWFLLRHSMLGWLLLG